MTTAITVDSTQTTAFAGNTIQRGDVHLIKQVSPYVLTDADATLRGVHMKNRLLTCIPTTDRTKTTGTATSLIADLLMTADDDAFDFTVINLGSGSSAFDVYIAAGTDVTLVGNMHVSALDVVDSAIATGSGQFRVRRVSSTTVSVYRLS